MEKALIAMSGGVDSSAAALLMKGRGYACAGATLLLLPGRGEDARDARAVCARLDMPHHEIDLRRAFAQKVTGPFAEAYRRGETPNPCVACNRSVKFGLLPDWAVSSGFSVLATGHYARTEKAGGRVLLRKAADLSKDQSYVLWPLTQKQLEKVCFPLGELTKPEVRALCAAHGLENAQKKDSQDICFVPGRDYAEYIEQYIGEKLLPGPILSNSGEVLGRHRGLARYTIGQRRGLGVPGGRRLYVAALDVGRNAVVLAENAALFSKTLEADHLNLIAARCLESPMRLSAKIRYRHKEQPATVEQIHEGRIRVTFDEPQRAVTPGQSVVLYEGDAVVGGAVIVK